MSDITMDCDKCQEFQYMKGRVDAESKYICHEDCISENCSMCIRWNKLSDCYEGAEE